MKKQIIRGEGIQGMCLTLNVCDMFIASQMVEELTKVLKNHSELNAYDKCAYDKRKEMFPNGRPERIELRDETLEKLHLLMSKMASTSRATLFETEDEPEYDSPF